MICLDVEEKIINEIKEYHKDIMMFNYSSPDVILTEIKKNAHHQMVFVACIHNNDSKLLRLAAEIKTQDIPIIFLTEDYNREKRVRYLQIGASIVLKQPCDTLELVYTAKALSNSSLITQISDSNFTVDLKTRKVWYHDQQIVVSPQIVLLVIYLIEHANRTISREELTSAICGDADSCSPRCTDTLIKMIRNLTSPNIIETKRGSGYVYNCNLKLND